MFGVIGRCAPETCTTKRYSISVTNEVYGDAVSNSDIQRPFDAGHRQADHAVAQIQHAWIDSCQFVANRQKRVSAGQLGPAYQTMRPPGHLPPSPTNACLQLSRSASATASGVFCQGRLLSPPVRFRHLWIVRGGAHPHKINPAHSPARNLPYAASNPHSMRCECCRDSTSSSGPAAALAPREQPGVHMARQRGNGGTASRAAVNRRCVCFKEKRKRHEVTRTLLYLKASRANRQALFILHHSIVQNRPSCQTRMQSLSL